MFSIGYSLLSRLNGDPRRSLANKANIIEHIEGVDCFLWWSPAHPVAPGRAVLDPLANLVFRAYQRLIPGNMATWIRQSRTIIIESGLPVVLFEAIRRINPDATVIYLASDDVATIGCASFILKELARTAPRYDRIILTGRALATTFPPGCRLSYVPHGLEIPQAARMVPSPYGPGRHAVSVGSMLFDRSFIATAASACPEVSFHVIGGGRESEGLEADNITVYGEMPFLETIGYIQHADIGLAPYRKSSGDGYLADTSMKLMQYGHLGVPAVCPVTVVGGHVGRFGYERGNRASITAALHAALAAGRGVGSAVLTWCDVVDRILRPDRFPDTLISSSVASLS